MGSARPPPPPEQLARGCTEPPISVGSMAPSCCLALRHWGDPQCPFADLVVTQLRHGLARTKSVTAASAASNPSVAQTPFHTPMNSPDSSPTNSACLAPMVAHFAPSPVHLEHWQLVGQRLAECLRDLSPSSSLSPQSPTIPARLKQPVSFHMPESSSPSPRTGVLLPSPTNQSQP